VELSLTGQLAPDWTVVAGAVLLDESVNGDAVRAGLIGRRPVGSTPVKAQVNVEYAPAGLEAWSFDLGVNGRDQLVATADGHASIPARVTLDIGARYRFKIGDAASLLRLQASNLGDTHGYVVLGPGAYKRADDRKLSAILTTDF
jgi:iron complex outermembrane receptor protein